MIIRRAKIRLAISYAIVQLVLFAGFGCGVYAYVTTAFDFDVTEQDRSAVTAEAGFANLRDGLLLAYLVLIVIIPLTSYGLATVAMRPVRAAYEAQQRFVDDASHELRTPLSAIQAQLELGLDRPRSSSEYRIAIGRSLEAASQLNEILDDLLVLSRSEQEVELHDVEVGSVIEGAIEQLPWADRARVHTGPMPELVIAASSSMLSRAVLNLVTNALRYSDGPVTIGAVRRGNVVRIAVEDHGIGMSRAQRDRAFDRFWQADPSRLSGGRGLGLSIVSEIVRVHRGRVELASKLGVGSTATIELPLSR